MQQIAEKDVNEKLAQFKEIATIADKLDSSETYKTAFDEELKAEAIKLLNKGFNIQLEDYQEQTKALIKDYSKNIAQGEHAPIENPTEEAKQDLSKFLKAQSTDFDLSEKMARNDDYAKAVKNHIPENQQDDFFSTLKQSVKAIIDTEAERKQFNEQHGKLFPTFQIDPIARQDLEEYTQTNDLYKAFEIVEKMKSPDYEKSIKELLKEKADNLGMPVENFSNNKINNLKDAINSLSDEQKAELLARFNQTYPDGFKTTREQEQERIKEEQAKIEEIEAKTVKRQEEFNGQLHDYLKTEYGNEEARIKQTQYLQEMIIREPQNFERLSQNFFTERDLRNDLPNESILKLDGLKLLTDNKRATTAGAVKLTENLKQRVFNSTKQLALTAKAGKEAIKSKEHLKIIYGNQFKREYVEAEKKLQMTRNLNQRQKLDSVKLSNH